jgi:hypothetical protein
MFNLKRSKPWAPVDEREEAELQSNGAYENTILYDRLQIA